MLTKIKSMLVSDKAESSLMMTIMIGVVAIVTLAGAIAIPGFGNDLRVQNTSVALQSIADAQRMMKTQTGSIVAPEDIPQFGSGTGKSGVRIAMPANVKIGMLTRTTDTYLLVARYQVSGASKYMYYDSRCDGVWVGTATYGQITDTKPYNREASCRTKPTITGAAPTLNLGG